MKDDNPSRRGATTIDRELPTRAHKSQASLRSPLRMACWAGLAAGGLPDAANRHMITIQEPASEFDTVLGRIGFDAKGDVTGYDTFIWYVWKDGQHAPVEPGKLTE